jgi:GNAT superfamily N-acetyltransferase
LPQQLPRELELRVLALWAGVLDVDTAVLDVDGFVVVTDPREFAANRRAVIRTARGALVLAAGRDVDAATADTARFVRDTESSATAVGLLHYLATAPQQSDARVRLLLPPDGPLLDDLVRAAGPEEAEEADVSIAHPCAVGILDGGRLVAAASLIDVGRTAVDVGVLVHPQARRRGLATAVVADISSRAGDRLVQYRCERGNEASAKVALACGFVRWGALHIAAVE